MPLSAAAPADQFNVLTGQTIRTCRLCGFAGTLTPENFYHRIDRGAVTWIDRRCQGCRRQRDAETRAARRTGRGRKWGVELEVICDRYALERELRRVGIAVRNTGYTHRVTSHWKILSDQSLPAGGCELVSPPLKGRAGLAQLKLACQALDAAGARVTRHCGLHVHHDVSDLNGRAFTRLIEAWSANQAHTDMLVAASRRGSNWAMPLRAGEVAHARTLAPDARREAIRRHFSYTDRYRSLNVASYPRQGTVELRQHQGTTNYEKVAAWIAYGQAIIKLAKGDSDAAATSPDVFAFIRRLRADGGLDADTANFLAGRAAHFSGRVPVAA